MSSRAAAEIFSDSAALELYLRIESALARVQAELGIIPAEAAREIARHAVSSRIDLRKLSTQSKKTGYPIAPLVRQLSAACGEHGRWVHWGATTQDILNTALALQVNESWVALSSKLRVILGHLAGLAREHRHVLIAARTFGGHALPITFGFKAAVWLSAMLRHARRLEALSGQPMEGEFAGVAGTLASLGERGLAVRAGLMQALGLPEPLITWSAMRDGIYERVAVLAGLTSTLAKILQDVAELSATEIGELAEPPDAGMDSSSALPFKLNPVHCSLAAGSATLVAQFSSVVLQAGRQREERSGEGLLEFEAVPLAFTHAERCIDHALFVLGGLQVFPERMRANLGLTRGIVLAERYVMALAPMLGRLAAHDLVHDLCRQAIEGKVDLVDVLAAEPRVTRHLDRRTISALADPAGYLGSADEMIDGVLAAAHKLQTNAG